MAGYTARDRVELINARIVDVENGCYFDPEVRLVLQDGKIAAMPGLPGESRASGADVVLDLGGMAVMPGLFNTHCHLQLGDLGQPREAQIARNLADCLARGVTTIRDTLCWDLSQNQAWADRIGRGELPGPRIVQAVHVGPEEDTYAPRPALGLRLMFSQVLKIQLVDYRDKRSGVVTFRPDAGEQEVRDAVDRAIDERGAAAIKFCDQPEKFMTYTPGANVISEAQLRAAVDQAQRRGVPTTTHNVTVEGFRQSIRAGVTSLAHLPQDGELTEGDVELLLGSTTCVEPTLTVAYYMSYNMKGSPLNGHPELVRLEKYRDATVYDYLAETWPPELQKNHRGRHELLKQGAMKVYGLIDISKPFQFMSACGVAGAQNLRRMVAHGAAGRLACGNDAGPADCSPAVIHQELAMFDFVLNRDGQALDPADMLRVATIQSARTLGLEDRLGSIRTGKIADLAVIDGDPLRDYRVVGRPVQALFMDGKLAVNKCGLQATRPEPLPA